VERRFARSVRESAGADAQHMSSVLLRRGVPADAEALALLEESASHSWSESQLREELARSEPDGVLVLEGRTGLVAYCAMRLVLDEVHIMNLAVHDVARRGGRGRFLLRMALARARRAGARRALLEVREGNTAARALYEAFGFAAVGRRKAYYTNPVEDALVLSRDESMERP
jgi:[ribosomal protein S18]-alanine N-acetyltransferase